MTIDLAELVRTSPRESMPSRAKLILALSICALVALALAAVYSGGAKSPLLPFLVIIVYVAGILGRHPGPAIGAVVAFLVATFAAEMILPGRWSHPLPTYAIAVALLVSGLAGSLFLGRLRAQLDSRREESSRLHQQAVRAVQERHRELIEVAGALAHQLKNPLSAVHGLATLLERRADGDAEILELAREARALNTAVHELLDFTRPVSDSALKRLALGALISELAAKSGAIAELSGETSAEVFGEPGKVSRVFATLVAAAARDGAKISVSVAKREDRVEAELSSEAPSAAEVHEILIARLLAEQHGAEARLSATGSFRALVSWPSAREPEVA